MVKIALFLAAGFLIGCSGRVKERGLRWSGRIQTVFLLLLIFCMGASIGRNEEVISSLSRIGIGAFLFAVATAAGSLLLVWLVQKCFFSGEVKK